MHLSHLNSILLDLLSSLDSGHHIGKAVGVNCGVTIAVGVRDSIGGGDSDLGDLDSVAGGDSDPGDGVGGGNHVVVGEVVIGHVVIGKGVVDSDGGDGRSSNLDRLSNLGGGGLHGLEAASLNIPEGGHESLLGLGDIHGVVKVGVGDLWGLDIIVDWHQVDVLSGLDCLVHSGEGILGGLDLSGVLEREGSHGGEADGKSLKHLTVKYKNFLSQIKLTILYIMVTREGVPEKLSQLTAGLTFRAGFYTRHRLGVAPARLLWSVERPVS